jgi:hypothetical protein
MSTDLYGVRVETVMDDEAILRVFLLYEDEYYYIPYDKGFVLCLLVDSLRPYSADKPLFTEIVPAAWWRQHQKDVYSKQRLLDHFNKQLEAFGDPCANGDAAERYISSVEQSDYQSAEKGDGLTFHYHDQQSDTFGEDESTLEQALLYIVATDAKWLSHLKEGQTFASACYAC